MRCAAEAISATRGGAGGAVADPAAHGSSQGFGHPSPPSGERRAPTPPPRQRLNTTRARHARALAGILRDPASGPDVARRWGHVVVACVVDALAAREEEDAEVATLLLDCALAVSTAAAASDGGATLDACISRALVHLSSGDPARARRGADTPPFHPRANLPTNLGGSGGSSQPSQEHFYIAPGPRGGSQGYGPQDGYHLAVGSSWDATWDGGWNATGVPDASCVSRGQIQLDSPAFGVAAHLASPQPRARHRGGTDRGRARLLGLVAELLALDVPRGSLPAAFLVTPGADTAAVEETGEWFGGTPPPGTGTHLHATHRRHPSHPDPCGAPSPLAVVIDALRDPAGSVDACLAALSVCAQLANRSSAFPGILASEPGAGHAMAAGSLAAVARIAGERGGPGTDADAAAVAEALLVVAVCAVADDDFNLDALLREYPPGVAIAKVPTFAGVVNDALLSPRLTLRADACDCVEVVVSARGDAGSVDRLLSFDVAEHVFELLRDLSRARGGRGVSVTSVTRTERDAAARTALVTLAALAERSSRGFNPRLALGAAPVATTLAAAQRDRDVEATSAGCRLLFAVASGDDPGNVPGESTAAFAAYLADACDEAASIHLSSDPSDLSGGGDVTVTEEGEWAQAAALAAAALAGFLRGWGGRDLDGDVAARVFATFVADVAGNLREFARGTPELDPPRSARDARNARDARDARNARDGGVFGRVRWRLGAAVPAGARTACVRLLSTGDAAVWEECAAVVKNAGLAGATFEATRRLSTVRRSGHALTGRDAEVADGVAAAAAASTRLLRALIAPPCPLSGHLRDRLAGEREDEDEDEAADAAAGAARRALAVEMVRDHRAIESCLHGTDAGVFDYDPYPRIPDLTADAWGASQGCNVFYDVPDSDDDEADDQSGKMSDHEPDHPTPALLCNFLAVLVPAALGEGSVIADARVVDALAAKVPPFGPRSAWARGQEGRDAPGDGRRVGLFDVMEAPDSTHGTLGTLGTRVGVAAARDALIACAFARATFGADVGTDADEFSRALAGPLCGYLVARRGGWCPSGLCASLAVWRACVQSLEGASASKEFNPGLRRLAGFVAETEAEIGANFVDALAGLHKLNAAGWRVAEETLVTYAMESASGSGRSLLSWLADTMPRNPRGIDACRSLFFSALNREDVARATSSDDEISADAPVGARTFASWFSDDVRTCTFLGTCFVDSDGGTSDALVRSLRFALRRRPPTPGALAIRGVAWDACVRLSGWGSASPIASGFRSDVVGRDIAADVALLHADAAAAAGGFDPPGSYGFAFDPGSLAGYLHDLIAVAAESPGAASVINAVLLNALLSKVHEATGAEEESRAVGSQRSVVRCLFDASVFPAVLAYARDVAVNWRSRTFSSLAGATSAVSLSLAAGCAIGGLASCEAAAGGTFADIDETFARALCDVGVECEDSICRRLAFEALATTGIFRGGGGEIRGIVLESGRAGMCAGTSEGERDAAAMCAIPFDAGGTPDEYYWEEMLLEEWLLGAASVARRDGAEPTEENSHPIAGRLAFARHVTSRSGRILCRVLREGEMRGTLVSLALTAAWRSRGADPAPIGVLRTLFVDDTRAGANDEVASARRAVPHDALRGCVDALRKVLTERPPPSVRGGDPDLAGVIRWFRFRDGASGIVSAENVHSLAAARVELVEEAGRVPVSEAYDPGRAIEELCRDLETSARGAKLREGAAAAAGAGRDAKVPS